MICATHATALGTSTAMDPPDDAPKLTVAGPAFVTRLTYPVAFPILSMSRCDQQPLRRLWLVTAATAQFLARALATTLVSIGRPVHSGQASDFGQESVARWLQPCSMSSTPRVAGAW